VPLRDRFRPPLGDDTPRSVFHGNWATKIVGRPNGERLSEAYKAQAGRHFGARIEADVDTLERNERGSLFAPPNGHRGLLTPGRGTIRDR
jgi:hypothetical protein